MWDYEHAYPGAAMVAVLGFPRPLYPPDANAHGKKPSTPGPDVLAYKRTVARAGRWEWQPFDEAYSNAFAHGKSGNVIDTGVAGVQRQQHIDPSGWLGKQTFNTLRSIVIPEGLPHAGEMAMDSYSADLLTEAWELYGGSEPEPDGVGTVRQAALELARSQLGYVEGANNANKYGEWYGANNQPWCAIFVTWSYELGKEGPSPSFVRGSRYAYVPYLVADAQDRRYGLSVTDDPIPGDLCCYDWQGDGERDHVGLFERWTSAGSIFDALEGNTSLSSSSNGGEVMRRSRTRSQTTFVHVAEP